MDDRELEEQLLPKLVRIHGERLDPNLLAAYVDGALPADEHAEVEARIAADPDALMLVRALREDRARGTTRNWTLAALAATVVLALGVWWTNRGDEPGPLDFEGRLAAVTADLGRADPELFAGFELLGPDEQFTQPGATRGGPRWLAPVGLLRTPPRELRWRNPPGAMRVALTIRGPGTSWKREIEGERHAAPDLAPGRYVVTLRPLDTLAGQPLRRVFEVADAEGNAQIERGIARIRETAPDDLVDLVVAHFCTRLRLFDAARAAALAAQSHDGDVGARAAALVKHLDAVAAR